MHPSGNQDDYHSSGDDLGRTDDETLQVIYKDARCEGQVDVIHAVSYPKENMREHPDRLPKGTEVARGKGVVIDGPVGDCSS